MTELQNLTEFLENFSETINLRRAAKNDLPQLRNAASMTQKDLSEATGKSQAYISQVENGVRIPSTDTLNIFYSAIADTAEKRKDAYNNKEEKSDEEE